MNYSEKKLKEKQARLESEKRKVQGKIKVNGAILAIVFTVGIIFCGTFCVMGTIAGIFDSAPSLNRKDILSKQEKTIILDGADNKMETLNHKNVKQQYVKMDEISDQVKNAFVAYRDPDFYTHHGVNFQGIMNTFSNKKVSDGTAQVTNYKGTITQELLENQVYVGENVSSFLGMVARRIQEQYLSVKLEGKITKSQILEYYLNTLNFEDNIVGVQAESMHLFDEKVSELNVSEATVLVAVAQNPQENDPVKNPANNKALRKEILKDMLDQGTITEEDYEDALGDDVYSRIALVSQDKKDVPRGGSTYYADAVVEQVISDLKSKLGYTETQAYNMVYYGGLRIYSNQNKKIQKICDSVVENPANYPKGTRSYLSYELVVVNGSAEKDYTEKDVQVFFQQKRRKKISLYVSNESEAKKMVREFKKKIVTDGDRVKSETLSFVKQPQVSLVFMDQNTGIVKAICGGRGENKLRTVNRATQFNCQPGTALSVLSSYLPALDTTGESLATVEDDAAYQLKDNNKDVFDWDSGNYRGLTSIRSAIARSVNVVAAKTLERVTPQTGFDYLKSLGFTSIIDKKENENGTVDSDICQSLAIGKLINGVSNLEMTNAYATIANGGKHREPSFYSKVVDKNGNILLQRETGEKQVMKESTAWLLTSSMKNVVTDGTGRYTKFSAGSMAQAVKTGTTEEGKNSWTIGYTPYYTAGVWTGVDNLGNKNSNTISQKIWKNVMEQVQKEKKLKGRDFTMPENIASAVVCTKCGKLAIDDLCNKTEQGNCTKREYFVKQDVPAQSCDCHVRYSICKKTGLLAGPDCPAKDIITKVFLLKDKAGKTEDSPYVLPKNRRLKHCENQHSPASR